MDDFITRAEHKEFADRLAAEDERQNKRISSLEETVKEINRLTVSVERMAVSMQSMTSELNKQGQRLEAIEAKPAKNWDKLIWVIGGAVVAAIIAFIMKTVGIG